MRVLPALAFVFALAAAPVFAQAPAPTRVRGTIVKLDGHTLVVHARGGADIPVTLTPDASVTSVTVTKLADIKPGNFIGTAAVTQPDGTMKALEVHIFPESMRGTGEGHRPWDAGPQSTMTNGTVGQIAGTNGTSLTVKYKDGEKTVLVPPDVPVVQFDIGTMSQLTPGAHVVINGTKAADGAVSTSRVTVGKDGIDLPL
jgi:hypothetical protein